MRYSRTLEASFVERPNRFVAYVLLDGVRIGTHVKNTGRGRELLVPGARVVLSDSGNPGRKYRYDIVAVWKGDLLVNIDSQAPNKVFGEWIGSSGFFGPSPDVHPEHVHGDSRFDFYLESDGRRIYVEVKGVTLEEEGVVLFPDAPTERGRKHMAGLGRAVSEGYEAYAAFVVQMGRAKLFRPNRATDPAFADALAEAVSEGVNILCLGCEVTEDSMSISYSIPYDLARGPRPASSGIRSDPAPGGP